MLIRAKTLGAITGGDVTVLMSRNFLEKTHPDTDYPYRELRGYTTEIHTDHLVYEPIPAVEVFESYTTDSASGDPIDPEPEAIYCGPETRIRGEDHYGNSDG